MIKGWILRVLRNIVAENLIVGGIFVMSTIRITLCLLALSIGAVQSASTEMPQTPARLKSPQTPKTPQTPRNQFAGLTSAVAKAAAKAASAFRRPEKELLFSAIKRPEAKAAVRSLRMQLVKIVDQFCGAFKEQDRMRAAQQLADTIINQANKSMVALETGRSITLLQAALWHRSRTLNTQEYENYLKFNQVAQNMYFRDGDDDAIRSYCEMHKSPDQAQVMIQLYSPQKNAEDEQSRKQKFLEEGETTILDYAIDRSVGAGGDDLGLHLLKFLLAQTADISPFMDSRIGPMGPTGKQPGVVDLTVRELVAHSRISPSDNRALLCGVTDAGAQGTWDRAKGFIESAHKHGMGYFLVNAQNALTGKTALHYAVQSPIDSSVTMMQILLESGADQDIRDNDGFTAFEYLDRAADAIPLLDIIGEPFRHHMTADLLSKKRQKRDDWLAAIKAAREHGTPVPLADYVIKTQQIRSFINPKGVLIAPEHSQLFVSVTPAADALDTPQAGHTPRSSVGDASSYGWSTHRSSAAQAPSSTGRSRRSSSVSSSGTAFTGVHDDHAELSEGTAAQATGKQSRQLRIAITPATPSSLPIRPPAGSTHADGSRVRTESLATSPRFASPPPLIRDRGAQTGRRLDFESAADDDDVPLSVPVRNDAGRVRTSDVELDGDTSGPLADQDTLDDSDRYEPLVPS
jgi:hypothetical protein